MTSHGSKASASSQCLGESFDRDKSLFEQRFRRGCRWRGPVSKRRFIDAFIEVEAGMHYHKGLGAEYAFGIPPQAGDD